MNRLIALLFFTLSLIGCIHSTATAQTADSSVQDEKVDHTKQIELLSVETGWKRFINGQPMIHLLVKNISGKPINDEVVIKYRLTENDIIRDEGVKTIHSNDLIPWKTGLVKSVNIKGRFIIPNVKQSNIYLELYDGNNNHLWEGYIEVEELDLDW